MLRLSTPSPLSRSYTADSLELGASATSPPLIKVGNSVKRELFSPLRPDTTEVPSAVQKAREFMARRTKAKAGAGTLPPAPKGAVNPSAPIAGNGAVNPSAPIAGNGTVIPGNGTVIPSAPTGDGAVIRSAPIAGNGAVIPSAPTSNGAVIPSAPTCNGAVIPSAPTSNGAVIPPAHVSKAAGVVVNPSMPVKAECLALVRPPPPRQSGCDSVQAPVANVGPIVKSCAVPPPVCLGGSVPSPLALCNNNPAPPPPKAGSALLDARAAAPCAAKSAVETAVADAQVNKKAKTAATAHPPPATPPKKASPVPKAAVNDEKHLIQSVGKLQVMNDEARFLTCLPYIVQLPPSIV